LTSFDLTSYCWHERTSPEDHRPVRILENAVKVTGKGVTLTVIEGLEELDRRAKRSALRALRGKVRFELDLEETRR
jgi:hypothetical protein